MRVPNLVLAAWPAPGAVRPGRWLVGLATWWAVCSVAAVATANWWTPAGTLPLFRFALENWAPDAYEIYLFHDADLDPESAALVQEWQAGPWAAGGVNLRLQVVDLRQATTAEEWQQWRPQNAEPGAQAVVVTPRLGPNTSSAEGVAPATERRVIGTLPWTREALERLVDSPRRRELSQRLIAGEVVWVFLAAGPEEKSNELKAILTQELDRRQDEDPSPEAAGDTDPASGSAGATGMPCSTLWLDRGDPEEAWLIANLLAMEPDLASDEFGDLNLVFPLYGRGRILTALMGNGVNPAILRQTVQVLRAPCQNESKAANPGLDLLLSVDWAERLAARPPDRLAAGAAFGQGAGASAVDPTLPGGPLEAAAGISKSGRAWRERSDGAEPMERGAAEAAITADVGEIQIPAADLPDVRDEVNRPGGKVDPLERPAPAVESGPVTWLPWSLLGVLALFAVVVAVWVWRWY